MTIKTRNELVAILTDAWKKELIVNINGIIFFTLDTDISFIPTTDGTPNNYMAIYKDNVMIGGLIVNHITHIFTDTMYKLSNDFH